ncbi:MAG: TetR/AcrR family transcriptional regulator [Sandaracinus sp.]|nr:TetR/AcrR family transcriptional regulator [Myxococcales bacterium]MCB9603218.1 TetR/AcrR family transcriptional regulator [Sandaracinus sp.]MCB9612654.1 TetR/AcrR family transcriptional regulator [Sandaracinus sp.]MCB9619988.1 TetR/AcrR family transcriptional regulator [Sandaracinus sp.]MCB9623016.1 TetR/AcrR family transcriptional regulator [Sandaracinus sp.]
MRYPPSHKPERRARIVDAASRLFRKNGFAATSVGDVMKRAELTHGGFYGYFQDKLELFDEALVAAFAQARENLFARGLESLRGDEWLRAAADRYATLAHRDNPDRGCAVPSLAGEVSRSPRPIRRRFSKEVAGMIDAIAERLDGEGEATQRRAARVLSTWVGAMLIARAVDDRRLAERILEAAREA